MSLDQPNANKMMESAPAKKEFHFPSDGVHYAAAVWAETTEEAEKIYHTIKKRIDTSAPQIETAPSAATVPAADEAAPTDEIINSNE